MSDDLLRSEQMRTEQAQEVSSDATSQAQRRGRRTVFNSIRFKLSMIAAIPLLFALVLAAGWLGTAYNTYSDMSDFDRLVQLASRMGAYMHETQKERGTTGVFMGSGGARFGAETAEQRRVTDTVRATLKEYLATYDGSAYGEKFDEELAIVAKGMELFDEHRANVDSLSIPAREGIAFYVDHNAAMLTIITRMAKLGYDSKSTITCAAYESFLQGKERAGLERAVMSMTFAAGHFETGVLQQFASLVTAQDTFFDGFLEFAPSEHTAFYHRALSGSVVDEVQRMRNIAFAKGEASPKHRLCTQLLGELSFGGLIHNFKNYVLRYDPQYAKRFRGNYERASRVLDELAARAETDEERETYAVIQRTLDEYERGLAKIVDAQAEGKTVIEIDKLVKVDDDPALAALARLSESVWNEAFSVDAGHWFNTTTKKINIMKEVEDRLAADLLSSVSSLRNSAHSSLILVSLIATIVTLAVLVVVFVIGNRIVRPIEQLSEAAKLVAQGNLDQRIESGTTDEIGALGRSFNGMVLNLKELFGELSTLRSALDEHAIVSMTDIWGDITYANEKFCEVSGYSHDELIGQNHRIVKSDEHPPELFRQMWLTISNGGLWHGEVKNRRKNGSHYWVDATIVPFRAADGKIEKYVAIRTDITQVKEAEEKATRLLHQLGQTNLELEGQKEETDAMNVELLSVNFDLEAARSEATKATKAKSDFLANMSHEIRTPMTAILGFAEILRESGDISLAPQHRIDAIDTIHSNGEYLLTIINDILDMSKIGAGKMEVERIPCSPHAIIADVVTLLKVRADAKSIVLNTECVGLVPETIQSDPTRLKQILINIIGNAIKFTNEGGVRLITRFVPGDEDDQSESAIESHLQFDIIDSGVGMTEEQAGNLFQEFSQADSTMARKFGGTGLGLTISKKLAEMLGGDITIVDSEPGCGTRFRTTIATGSLEGVKMVDPTAVARTSKPAKAPQTVEPLGCRILLAEDGPDNQRLIAFVLKKAGADVTVAEDGQIAFDQALAAVDQGKPFDVILMDMQMPVLDGYAATTALRDKGYKGPIIALTAHAMVGDREKCIDAGCDDYASKPIDRNKLIATIREHLHPVAIPACAS